MGLLKWWFSISGALMFVLFCYAYVPVVLPVFAIAGGLGLITYGIVSGARALERKLGRDQNDRE